MLPSILDCRPAAICPGELPPQSTDAEAAFLEAVALAFASVAHDDGPAHAVPSDGGSREAGIESIEQETAASESSPALWASPEAPTLAQFEQAPDWNESEPLQLAAPASPTNPVDSAEPTGAPLPGKALLASVESLTASSLSASEPQPLAPPAALPSPIPTDSRQSPTPLAEPAATILQDPEVSEPDRIPELVEMPSLETPADGGTPAPDLDLPAAPGASIVQPSGNPASSQGTRRTSSPVMGFALAARRSQADLRAEGEVALAVRSTRPEPSGERQEAARRTAPALGLLAEADRRSIPVTSVDGTRLPVNEIARDLSKPEGKPSAGLPQREPVREERQPPAPEAAPRVKPPTAKQAAASPGQPAPQATVPLAAEAREVPQVPQPGPVPPVPATAAPKTVPLAPSQPATLLAAQAGSDDLEPSSTTVKTMQMTVAPSQGGRISLRFVERGGEVQVIARTANPELAEVLRNNAPELTRQGYEALPKTAQLAAGQTPLRDGGEREERGMHQHDQPVQPDAGQGEQKDRSRRLARWLSAMDQETHVTPRDQEGELS